MSNVVTLDRKPIPNGEERETLKQLLERTLKMLEDMPDHPLHGEAEIMILTMCKRDEGVYHEYFMNHVSRATQLWMMEARKFELFTGEA